MGVGLSVVGVGLSMRVRPLGGGGVMSDGGRAQ